MSTPTQWNNFSRFAGAYGYTCVNPVTDEMRRNVINRVFGGWTRAQLAIIGDIREMMYEMHRDDFHPHSEECIECFCYVAGKT